MNKVTEHTFPPFDINTDKDSLMWQEISSEKVCSTPIFDVTSVHRQNTDGTEGTFTVLKSHNWVNVIPYFIGNDGIPRFIMERQYRHGSASVTMEFPGGIVELDENPEQAAKRELEEETGIRSHKLTFLGQVNPNSAFLSNSGYFFLAEELENTGTRNFDLYEKIETVCISCDEALSRMGKGEFNNGVMLIAAFLFQRFKNTT